MFYGIDEHKPTRSVSEALMAGDYVLKPRDIPHTFWNPGPAPLRVLECELSTAAAT